MANTLIAKLNNPLVLQQINQRLAAFVNVLLIIACAWLLVEITWLFFPQGEPSAVPAVQTARPSINKQAQQDNFRQLTSANVFGVSEKAAVQQSKAPETKLNLTLKGVLAAIPMEMASAIIAQGKNGKEDIYGIGDKMPGGVEIKEIYPEYVVLERSGRLETLKLQKVSGVGGLNSGNQSSLRSGRYSRGTPAAALKDIRSNILKNPTSFGEYALPVVVKENGKQIGYRLKPQQKGQMLSELGIESSDVITQINGVKLDNQQNGISALRKLSTAKNLNIVVKRNGAEVPLNISLQ
ncbi:MAG: type II secretion system protein GspC [Gammaproteobacteria bacterium]|nr:type II secretion system protein GspC [Gammaproteobacteria bacterium]MBT8133862.1 type II secretion system protein GspC [Gammaproteobacteria bacterium]NNJ50940.1 type II secretion system protein GspC [Gammaproteobacteria bacterium]